VGDKKCLSLSATDTDDDDDEIGARDDLKSREPG
jgi:hypothetical protein